MLWGWWGCIAGLLWNLAPRYPSLVRFSPEGIAAHLVTASALGVAHLLLLWSLGFPFGWDPGTTAQTMWQALMNPNRFGMEILLYGFIFGIIGVIQFRSAPSRRP